MKICARYSLRISCCVVLLVTILAVPVTAASLGGTVAYKAPGRTTADPLASVLVSVYSLATRKKTVTRTSDLGKYLFRELPAGSYVILIEKGGSRIYQGKVEVRDPETRLDIQL